MSTTKKLSNVPGSNPVMPSSVVADISVGNVSNVSNFNFAEFQATYAVALEGDARVKQAVQDLNAHAKETGHDPNPDSFVCEMCYMTAGEMVLWGKEFEQKQNRAKWEKDNLAAHAAEQAALAALRK
jgi:hypothetical protein